MSATQVGHYLCYIFSINIINRIVYFPKKQATEALPTNIQTQLEMSLQSKGMRKINEANCRHDNGVVRLRFHGSGNIIETNKC